MQIPRGQDRVLELAIGMRKGPQRPPTCTFTDCHWTECLTPAGVPDRTRSVVVQSFAPYRLRLAAAVDVHFEVVAERKAEAVTLDVAVSGKVCGELCFARPGRTAVGRAAVVDVPERVLARIHPSDSHVTRRASHNCGEAVFDSQWRR